jgi:protein-tyrosine phosphatase
MIDVHCHILPGVDDGAKTIEDSVAMARMAADAGTTKIVATPHMNHPQYHVPGPLAKAKLEEVRAAVLAAKIPIEIVLAGEIHWSSDVPAQLASGELLPYCADHQYILFELPMSHVPDATREVMWKFQLAGIYPVLAHPERNMDFERNPDLIHQYRDAGVPCQITAMSLTGDFGRKARKLSERWLAEGAIDLLASDGHSARSRPPTLADAARIVRKQAGETVEDWLTCEVPRRILAGEPVVG